MTTGAGNDIEQATDLARKMVCEWGMSEKMGPITFGHKEEQPFLGRDMGHQANYSEDTARAIDAEVKRIVMDGYECANKALREQRRAAQEDRRGAARVRDHRRRGHRHRARRRPDRAPPAAAAARRSAVEAAKEKRPSIFARPPVLKDEPEKA